MSAFLKSGHFIKSPGEGVSVPMGFTAYPLILRTYPKAEGHQMAIQIYR